MISPVIMGSPVRRLLNPITRCRDQPRNRYAGTDDGPGTGQRLDANQLTLMSGCRPQASYDAGVAVGSQEAEVGSDAEELLTCGWLGAILEAEGYQSSSYSFGRHAKFRDQAFIS